MLNAISSKSYEASMRILARGRSKCQERLSVTHKLDLQQKRQNILMPHVHYTTIKS